MEIELDPVQVRILGALVEKELTTPDYYPLSLASLVTACNQKSNRDPVMELSESALVESLDDLLRHHLVWERSGSGSRVVKYAHRLSNSLFPDQALSKRELAVLAVLMLRGPQTVGELRTRTGRMADFDSLEAVENTLLELATRNGGPYVMELPRQPGQREQRYAHLLGGEPEMPAATAAPASSRTPVSPADDERLAALEEEVAALRDEVAGLREEVEALRGGRAVEQ